MSTSGYKPLAALQENRLIPSRHPEQCQMCRVLVPVREFFYLGRYALANYFVKFYIYFILSVHILAALYLFDFCLEFVHSNF